MRAMQFGAALAGLLAFPSLAYAGPSGRNAPNLEACRHIAATQGTEIQRTDPISVPPELLGIMRSNMTHLAVSTLGGRTLCLDASWMENIDQPELSADGRFVRFGWYGYETAGYMLVDRAGKGAFFDTGDRPVVSPSGMLAAVVQYSEAGFGSLEGLGVWQVGKVPMRELARLTLPEGMTDWRMEGWQGEACIVISALRFEDLPDDEGGTPKAPRKGYVASSERGKWQIAAGTACTQS